MHHSDRGSQYASVSYRSLLELHGIECSMSRAGDCYDNAVIESFFGTFKQVRQFSAPRPHRPPRSEPFQVIQAPTRNL